MKVNRVVASAIYYPLDIFAASLSWVAFKLTNNKIFFWCLEQLPDYDEGLREEHERQRQFTDLMYGADVLVEHVVPKEPYRGMLAYRAVRTLMKEHYPELEEEHYG